jgi:hypothetical protein
MIDFSGRWLTTFGFMELTQHGNDVDGTYGGGATIHGTVQDGQLVFRYEEPSATGEGWFQLSRHGKFRGQWREDGSGAGGDWYGQRGFDGVWETTFGPMRLFHEADRVHGCYEGVGMANMQGQMQGDRFVFRYQEPKASGEGWFELDEQQLNFQGAWRPDGSTAWGAWGGRRRLPTPNLRWLVVLEAHWQRSLAEEECAFGHMLREFFARVGNVKVRHRFFQNEAGLEKWCRELMYLPEPAVLVIATHGNDQGLMAHGQPIGPRVLVHNLPKAESLMLLHFSACLMLNDGPAGETARALHSVGAFPVSGYTTSVDWAASAILEFTYFDLILSRGMPPALAAEQVGRLLSFAGDGGVPEAGFPGAGFRILLPSQLI